MKRKIEFSSKIVVERFLDRTEKAWIDDTLISIWDCPECGDPFNNIFGFIPHVNDRHEWSFDQIADWLEENENPRVKKVGVKRRSRNGR